MPNSRKRPPKRHSRSPQTAAARRQATARFGEYAPYIEQMLAVDEAERRGDARGALDLIEQKLFGPDGKLFWRGERIARLVQLATFGPLLPRWATSRWLLEQAVQELSPTRNRAFDRALLTVADIRGGFEGVPCPSGSDPRIKVIDHDWVFRQCVLYEFGVLASYLRRAPADLVAGADRIHSWARAPMGGFRYLARTPGVTTWADLASGDRIETPNIGSAAMLIEGEHVIGRMVPIEGGRMFETLPLHVSETVARAVADEPANWIEVLREASERGEGLETGGFRFGFLSDVRLEISALTLYGDLESLDRYETRAEQFLDAVRRAFRDQPTDDPEVIDVWACIAAELLNWNLFVALTESVRPDHADLYVRLGQILAEPAARFCRDLADEAQAAA
ncbi:hypothetical protein [Nocardioides pelophilus]|uniref:hypothetical protein n=1 Tax=Nocardioides pelophilus TaxID=2172019 RepID=UPI001603E629|nr:hypothetical protein [Nocardioides pelophilus]